MPVSGVADLDVGRSVAAVSGRALQETAATETAATVLCTSGTDSRDALQELYIAHTLARHFSWSHAALFLEDLPADVHVQILLSGADAIVPARLVRAYVEQHCSLQVPRPPGGTRPEESIEGGRVPGGNCVVDGGMRGGAEVKPPVWFENAAHGELMLKERCVHSDSFLSCPLRPVRVCVCARACIHARAPLKHAHTHTGTLPRFLGASSQPFAPVPAASHRPCDASQRPQPVFTKNACASCGMQSAGLRWNKALLAKVRPWRGHGNRHRQFWQQWRVQRGWPIGAMVRTRMFLLDTNATAD